MTVHWIAVSLAFVLPVLAASDEGIRLKFEDLPKLVEERNLHVSGAKAFVHASEKGTGHLARSFLPTLEAYVGGETFRTGPFSTTSQAYGGAEVRWNVYRGGVDLLEERVREARLRGSQASFDRVRFEEISKARRAYWELVYQREVVELLVDAQRQNESNLVAARKRIAAGLATDTDRIEFEMYRVAVDQDLARMKLGSANSQRTLSILLGLSENALIQTDSRIPHQHDDAFLSAKFYAQGHRDVTATEANEEVAESQRVQAYRWWTPQLDVYASYSLYTLRERDFLDQSERFEPVAGVRLRFNFFDGLQSRTQGAALSLQSEGFANQAKQTTRELSALFSGAKQELVLTHDLIHTAEKSIEQAAQYLERTQSEYARGVKNSPDVFSATQKYIELKRRSVEIRRDYQLAKIELLSMLGE